MTVTQAQIDAVKKAGFENVELIADACNRTGCRFYLAVSMIEKESKGKNVWGHDAGGTFSGLADRITESSWRAFRHEVLVRGRPSNGVGPAQLTFKGFFTDMEKQGLNPADPKDNIFYGVRLIYSYYRDYRNLGASVETAVKEAGTKYNGASAYGDSLWTIAQKWRSRLGSADYA